MSPDMTVTMMLPLTTNNLTVWLNML